MSQVAFDSDINVILSRRHANGADFWATNDGRIYVGNPFSTISSLGMLYELGVGKTHEAVQGGLRLILDASQDDGRIRVAPKAPMYPCYTAEAVRVLCRFGLKNNAVVKRAISYLLENTDPSGGWRCNFTRFGKGPETNCANPGATLYALDIFRWIPKYRKGNNQVDNAVDFLLMHWDTRKPIGPCHWGIGKAFMKVEYPFWRYNLFFYVYVLSFFERALRDDRFRKALQILKTKQDSGKIIVEHSHRGLKGLKFCEKGIASQKASKRYREILKNIK